jgi:hypothetical protein
LTSIARCYPAGHGTILPFDHPPLTARRCDAPSPARMLIAEL